MIPDHRATRIWRALAIFAVLAVAILACTRDRDEPRAAHAGRRIISIGGAVTEIAYALGAGQEIIAVDTSSVFPAEVHALPKVGYQRTLSAEGILALSPDLILAAEEAGPPATITQLEAAGVRIARMANATDVDSTIARILVVGKVLGKEAEAAALATRMKADVAAAIAKVPADRPRFVLMFARGAGSLMAAGDDTSGAAMVTLAGGHNAATGFTGYKAISAEALVAAAPDVIVVPAHTMKMVGGVDGVLKMPGVDQTPAGQHRRIVAFDDLLLLGFGPRLATGIATLSSTLRGTPAT